RCLDMVFREDDSRVRKDNGPDNMAMLRHLTLNLLRQEKTSKASIRRKRLKAGWDEDYLLKVLSAAACFMCDCPGEFINDACIIGPNFAASSKSLFAAYTDWCHKHGERPVSQRRLGLALGERGFIKTKSKTVTWQGIGIASADHTDLRDQESNWLPTRARSYPNPKTRSPKSTSSQPADYAAAKWGERCIRMCLYVCPAL